MVLFETERLIIRSVESRYMIAILDIYRKEENMKYISSGKFDWTMEELQEKYQKVNPGYPVGLGIFVVTDKVSGKVIGEAGLFDSFQDRTIVELGYILDSAYWGKGLGKEVCQGLIEYSFRKLKAKKVVARMYADNISSVKLSESVGMNCVHTGKTPNGDTFHQYEIVSGDPFI